MCPALGRGGRNAPWEHPGVYPWAWWLEEAGVSPSSIACPCVSLALYQREGAGWLGAGHSSARAKAAPETIKLVLLQ